jgi:LCP family protein required for cell wall assembly
MNTVDATCSLMSLPRDTMVNVNRSGAGKKLNNVYQSEGYEALAQKVAETTGVYPDFYVKIEWEAVGTLVDAIGGVEFDVPYDMNYEDPTPGQELYIHLSAGEQVLDGDKAMQLIRWRKNDDGSGVSVGDIGRMEITQNFLKAVLKQTLKPQNLANLNKLLEIFNENVETDLSLGNLLWFANAMKGIDTETGMYTCTLPADMYGSYHNISFVFPYADETVEIVNQYFNPYTKDITESDLSVMQIDANENLSVTNGTLLSD